MSAWREALRMMSIRLVASVWAGTLMLAVFGALWLQIPDSHLWEFALSLLFAGGLLALFFGFYTWVFRQVFQPAGTRRWWLEWAILAAVILAWWLLQIPIDRLVEHKELYAGYWQSRLPHGQRSLHTYEHLLLFEDWIYFLLRLLVTGFLLPVAIVAGTCSVREGMRRILRSWSRWWFWVATLVCGYIAIALSGKLMNWTPGHNLKGELLSLVLRFGFVFTFDVLLSCFVLAVVGVSLRRGTVAPLEESLQATPAITPDEG